MNSADCAEESQPLLSNNDVAGTATFPSSSTQSTVNGENSEWMTNNFPNEATVTCRICQSQIDISDKRDQHVVKCDNCNEATPIRVPPPGKKYVRCPCNCLLICKSNSKRIACPRPNCKRIITLAPNQNDDQSIPNGMIRVICSHCGDTFLFSQPIRTLARCPHCRKLSSVGKTFTRRKGVISSAIAILMLILGIIFASMVNHSESLIIAAVATFILAILLSIRGIYYLAMAISAIEQITP